MNGQYRGDLTFTQRDGAYGWPAHLTVAANVVQTGERVTGDFHLMELDYAGGIVDGTVDGEPGDNGDTFRAQFLPNDLGTEFTVEARVTSSADQLAGTFVFGSGVVGYGIAIFARCPCSALAAKV